MSHLSHRYGTRWKPSFLNDKASELAEHKVSRQTVHNLVHRPRADQLELPIQTESLKEIPALYIEADEDHIHLNNGKSAEAKLVYVHEGNRFVCKNRYELVNPRYFVTVGNDSDSLWSNVAEYVAANYSDETEIHISGDGAGWIKDGLEFFPRAKYHLDKFHVYKSVTTVAMGNRRFRNNVLKAIGCGNFDNVEQLYNEHYNTKETEVQKKRIVEGLAYLENNFDEIDLSSSGIGCAAEGHISHVLSSRLSSRPMGWSVSGAERIAKLRAFYFNGGNFRTLYDDSKEKSVKEPYVKYTMRANKKVNTTLPTFHVVGLDGVTDGYSTILRSLVQIRA